ncbi:hypothetical protein G6F37_007602 [Rhizopus arrhizus]|nr:hypothetical protein G6F38_008363 [Rhizopus arrhizus]KAG1156442.1 hypothetical protein G6F37_007602 [Rhizopus arrhizus]
MHPLDNNQNAPFPMNSESQRLTTQLPYQRLPGNFVSGHYWPHVLAPEPNYSQLLNNQRNPYIAYGLPYTFLNLPGNPERHNYENQFSSNVFNIPTSTQHAQRLPSSFFTQSTQNIPTSQSQILGDSQENQPCLNREVPPEQRFLSPELPPSPKQSPTSPNSPKKQLHRRVSSTSHHSSRSKKRHLKKKNWHNKDTKKDRYTPEFDRFELDDQAEIDLNKYAFNKDAYLASQKLYETDNETDDIKKGKIDNREVGSNNLTEARLNKEKMSEIGDKKSDKRVKKRKNKTDITMLNNDMKKSKLNLTSDTRIIKDTYNPSSDDHEPQTILEKTVLKKSGRQVLNPRATIANGDFFAIFQNKEGEYTRLMNNSNDYINGSNIILLKEKDIKSKTPVNQEGASSSKRHTDRGSTENELTIGMEKSTIPRKEKESCLRFESHHKGTWETNPISQATIFEIEAAKDLQRKKRAKYIPKKDRRLSVSSGISSLSDTDNDTDFDEEIRVKSDSYNELAFQPNLDNNPELELTAEEIQVSEGVFYNSSMAFNQLSLPQPLDSKNLTNKQREKMRLEREIQKLGLVKQAIKKNPGYGKRCLRSSGSKKS